jgi:hypothetical protein
MIIRRKAPAGGTAEGLIKVSCFEQNSTPIRQSRQAKTCSSCGEITQGLQIYSILLAPASPATIARLCARCVGKGAFFAKGVSR